MCYIDLICQFGNILPRGAEGGAHTPTLQNGFVCSRERGPCCQTITPISLPVLDTLKFSTPTKPFKPFKTTMDALKTEPKTKTKTYGCGHLRINLNSPRGNIYSVWGVALNLMKQLNYTEEKQTTEFAKLKAGNYEECLKAFGDHKVFGNLFQLYYSPEYTFDWDEGEWGNPNEEDE